MANLPDSILADPDNHAGWVIDLQLTAAEIIAVHRAGSNVVTLRHPASLDLVLNLDVTHELVRVDLADPREWPPRAGDLWHSSTTGTAWFVYIADHDLWSARDQRGRYVHSESPLGLAQILREFGGSWRLEYRDPSLLEVAER
jgi:hypothetical protein